MEWVTLAVVAYFVAVLNLPFWRTLVTAVEPSRTYDWLFIGGCFVAMFALFNLVLTILGTANTFKPLVMFLLPVTAGISYFMWEYGVVIDGNMIQNAIETNTNEARDLISLKMVTAVVLGGLLPAYLMWRTPIAYRPFWQEVWAKLPFGIASAVIALAAVAAFFMDFTSVFREHKELRLTLTPSNYITAIRDYGKRFTGGSAAVIAEPFGTDATRGASWTVPSRKSVTVLVVGETARAANFSLNGYARETNFQLGKLPGLINFPNVTSCGTATAQSVPCMFSGAGRAHTSTDISIRREGLLHMLQRAGFAVTWRENQAGCKAVCNNIPTEILTDSKLLPFYNNDESNDAILVDGLEDRVVKATGDSVIVLHLMGSHGPTYFKRYPPEFEKFTPVCKSAQFSRCTSEEIVNAYDNTILYTDHVLAELAGVLQKLDAKGHPSSMIYVSDHGESLGEKNIYLHGMPYAIAPKEQTHVPMVMWLSPLYQSVFGIDGACMAQHAAADYSHDNFFHSVLGMLDVKTTTYDAALDMFAPCRTEPGNVGVTSASPQEKMASPQEKMVSPQEKMVSPPGQMASPQGQTPAPQ